MGRRDTVRSAAGPVDSWGGQAGGAARSLLHFLRSEPSEAALAEAIDGLLDARDKPRRSQVSGEAHVYGMRVHTYHAPSELIRLRRLRVLLS